MNQLVKGLVAAFLVSTYKSLPLAYCFKFYYRIIINLILPRFKYLATHENTFGITSKTNKLDLFEYTTFNTYVSPLEIDMYLHKSNSTYLVDLDIARTDLVTKIFQVVFYKYFDNFQNEFKSAGKVSNFPYVPVASIQCIFKKELTLFQKFQIKSKVLAWDQKWLFVLSKFVIPNGSKNEKLCAIAITKYVFKKNGRITIKPIDLIKDAGLYNDEIVKINEENYKLVDYMSSTDDLEQVASNFGHILSN
ncbi:hypothetical protein HYPBUDRAFT_155521 [Hyphopichia burtonii NRRL Y-1933]|uniref:Thioesterase/thiol ester dehydrase-isomerase n=1 Tax=Hyphopichia burtonii NRRL Y-1933 TaxID=984485 RepID=A0A1E4RMC0_9ASCO|nr:hypothetical protein HYPBUDRAFT_155521 [Hyphopichia burtonii NRRL Y-1933]ODV68403.1 hypothetical protein HYPBUDRAFT_155521 [Hyphopichia burtonii NRRL Y-1933]